MKQYFDRLILVMTSIIMIPTLFTSCTNEEEVDLTFNTDITVTAAHIYENFQAVFVEDFAMSGYGVDWEIGLHLFVYDEDGNLIDNKEESSRTIDYSMKLPVKLVPGEYKLVAIAEFHLANGNGEDFWTISGKSNIRDLKITESDNIMSVAQGILGLYTSELSISDSPNSIVIDIPAVTALLINNTWMGDYIEPGSKGFSKYAPDVQTTRIYSESLSQSVTFDGIRPVFDNGNSGYRYVINNVSPRNQYRLDLMPRMAGYRALLPQNNQSFYWQLTFVNNEGQKYGYNNDVLKSNSTELLNIETGKQYYTDLILDIMTLTFGEYNPSVNASERVEQTIDSYKKNSKIEGAAQIDRSSSAGDNMGKYTEANIAEALELNYDEWMGISEAEFVSKMSKFSEFSNEETTISYYGKGLIQLITARFTNQTKTCANRIMLTWDMDSKDQYDAVSEYLAKKYTFYRTESTYIQYLNAPTFSDATCGITWDSKNFCLFFDKIK